MELYKILNLVIKTKLNGGNARYKQKKSDDIGNANIT